MTEPDKSKYPSNSKLPKEGDLKPVTSLDQPEQKVKKVPRARVIKKKPGFSEVFFGDDASTVGSYILWDVLIPAVKSAISDMVTTGIEMLLFGESRSQNIRRDRSKSHISYTNYYQRDPRDKRPDRMERRNKARHRFDDIIFPTRAEAEECLSSLADLVDTYEQASVADFYDIVGIDGDFSDNKYGWESLGAAEAKRVRDGYILVLPRPLPLD